MTRTELDFTTRCVKLGFRFWRWQRCLIRIWLWLIVVVIYRIVVTAGLILALPLIIEMDREAQLIEVGRSSLLEISEWFVCNRYAGAMLSNNLILSVSRWDCVYISVCWLQASSWVNLTYYTGWESATWRIDRTDSNWSTGTGFIQLIPSTEVKQN